MTNHKDIPTMLTYITETPEQLTYNIKHRKTLVKPLVDLYLQSNYKNICLIASGSSSNAAQCAKAFMMKYLNVDVKIIPPSSFVLLENNISKNDFAIVISQSGCSTNSIEALKKLDSLGLHAIGVTGNVNSDFKNYATTLIDYGVGIEKVGYVTKGVVTLIYFLISFALEIAYKNKTIAQTTYEDILSECLMIPEYHSLIQKKTYDFIQVNQYELTSMNSIYSCGFMQAYGIAKEAALKMGETIKTPSFAYEAEEFLHGPNLQLNPNYTIFLIDDLSSGSKRMIDIYKATYQVSKRTYLITNNFDFIENPNTLYIPFKIIEPFLSPLYILPFFQIISYMVTTELHRWKKHPLCFDFDKAIETKTKTIKSIMIDTEE